MTPESNAKMTAVQILGSRSIRTVELVRPSNRQDSARVAVEAVGICGSDVAVLEGTHPFARYPVISGHEISGRILEAPTDGSIKVGQRVAVEPMVPCGECATCQAGHPNRCDSVEVMGVQLAGGMAEEIIVPISRVRPVPASLDGEMAAMVEPTAVAVHVCHRGGLQAGDSVAVVGTGKIGLLCLAVAKQWGCGPLFGIDKVTPRLVFASRFGADMTANNHEQDALAEGRSLSPIGFDVVIDTAGEAETLELATALARPGGTVVPVALPHPGVPMDFRPIYRKELTLRASRMYVTEFKEAAGLLAANAPAFRQLITHRFSPEDAAEAFDLAAHHPEAAVKVVIQFNKPTSERSTRPLRKDANPS